MHVASNVGSQGSDCAAATRAVRWIQLSVRARDVVRLQVEVAGGVVIQFERLTTETVAESVEAPTITVTWPDDACS